MATTIIAGFESNVSKAGASAAGVLCHQDGQIEVFGIGDINTECVDDFARHLVLMASRIRNQAREQDRLHELFYPRQDTGRTKGRKATR